MNRALSLGKSVQGGRKNSSSTKSVFPSPNNLGSLLSWGSSRGKKGHTLRLDSEGDVSFAVNRRNSGAPFSEDFVPLQVIFRRVKGEFFLLGGTF